MKAADLDILLQEGEGVTLEYKESLSSSFARELVGSANTAGGKILLGVGEEVRAQVGAKESPSTAQVGTKKGPGRDQVKAHDEAHDKAHEVESTPQVPHKHPTSAPQVTPQVMILLRIAMREASAADLQSALHLKDRVHFLKNYLEPSLEKGLIQRTIPDKPRSSKQRYRTTAAGRSVLAHAEKETPS